MEQTYTRTARIDQAKGGSIGGILATNGEAADGHILDIGGAHADAPAPLLFGHDDWSGERNLGSWSEFRKELGKKKLGADILRGRAAIEVEGADGNLHPWRADVAHMIERGHIGQFSVRWDVDPGMAAPVRRVNLSADHPAFIDSESPEGRSTWGMFFPEWRLLEGSVVTLGADPMAEIGRAMQVEGELRQAWIRVAASEMPEKNLAPHLERMLEALEGLSREGVTEEPEPEPTEIVDPDPEPETEEPAPEGRKVEAVHTPRSVETFQDLLDASFGNFDEETRAALVSMMKDIIGPMPSLLRERMDRYFYQTFGRVPPRR